MKKFVVYPITASETFMFKIPVIWKTRAIISVTARSMKEAIQFVNSHDYELPEGEYVKDSFEIDYKRLES